MTDPTTPPPPVEEPPGYESTPGFVKSRHENNLHYVDQFTGHRWESAIREAAAQIHALCPRINISQIKSKFGSLRFYYVIPEDLTSGETTMGSSFALGLAVDQIIARAEGWCAGHDVALKAARSPEVRPVQSDFERGARAAAESMRFYFLDENEYPIYEELNTAVLEGFEVGAVEDVLRDEQSRIERLAAR